MFSPARPRPLLLTAFVVMFAVVLAVLPGANRTASASETTDSLRADVCGTWLLHQVSSVAQLDGDASAIDDALAQPGTVGLSIRVPWHAIDGDLSILERGLEMAEARGKAFSIRFMAGRHTPARVFDAGAHFFLNDSGERVPKPFSNSGVAGNPVFEAEYAQLTSELADWSRLNGVSLLHMSWYGYAWAEIYNDTNLQNAPGYSSDAWLEGHETLMGIAHGHSGSDLGVEFPLSGHWGGMNNLYVDIVDSILNEWGAWNEQVYVQGNGLGVYNGKSTHKAIYTAKQMYSVGDWDWPVIYDILSDQDEQYVEVYLSSFSGTNSAQLAAEAEEFDAAQCAPLRSVPPTTTTTTAPPTTTTIPATTTTTTVPPTTTTTTVADPDAPDVPDNVRAWGRNAGITVRFDAVVGAAGYDVRTKLSGASVFGEPVAVTSTTYRLTVPADGRSYDAQVRSRGDNGTTSAWSDTVSASTPGSSTLPKTPVGLAATTVYSQSFGLAWEVAIDDAVAEYRLSVDGDIRSTMDASVLSTWVFGLSPDTDYSVSLEALDSDGNASVPAVIEVHTLP